MKPKSKIIAALCLSLFHLTVVFVASAAWFCVKRSVDESGDGFMTSNYNGFVKGISIHSQTDTDVKAYNPTPVISYHTDKNGKLELDTGYKDKTPFVMASYDQLESSEISVLYVLELNGAVSYTHLTLPTSDLV